MPNRRNRERDGASRLVLVAGLMLLLSRCNGSDAPRERGGDQKPMPKARLESISSVLPESLRAAGPDLQMTPRGIPSKLIYRGRGKRRATTRDAIILYSQTYDANGNVTARGSELIGNPASDLTIDGQQAIQMMTEGDVRRFWFPDPQSDGRVKVTDFEIVWISPNGERP